MTTGPITLYLRPDQQRSFADASLRLLRGRVVGFIVVGACAIAGGVALQLTKIDNGLLLILMGGFMMMAPLLLRRGVRRAVARQPASLSTITITPERVRVESELTTVDASWSIVARTIETRRVFILCQGPRMMVAVLPKESFFPGDEERFRQLVAARSTARSRASDQSGLAPSSRPD